MVSVRGALIGVGAAVVLVVAGCAAESSEVPPSPADSPAGPSAAPSGAPGAPGVSSVRLSEELDHVHGLVAVGPDTVVAGTHGGAVTVTAAGQVSAAGDARDDLMGMTGEAGTQRLASSGHPGPGSAFPNPVGLIMSEDGGATWSPVSLQGQVDFHALAVSGANVIGYPGGAGVILSEDGGRTWQQGAALPSASLAYSGDRILATTQSGLQVSQDGGRSFAPVEGAPLLGLVSAGTDETVLGLDTEGVVWSSTDRGQTWVAVGPAPDAQAMAAFTDGGGYAVSQTTLYTIG